MISGHGDDAYLYKQINMDFSSNVPYLNSSSSIIKHLYSKLDCLQNYPDPEASDLRFLIAEREICNQNELMVCNGSTEAFYLLAHLFRGYETNIVVPSFAEYEDSCKLFMHHLNYLDIKAIQKGLINLSSLSGNIFLGVPNNPDGLILSTGQLEDFARLTKLNEAFLIIDTAYKDICKEMPDLRELQASYKNIILVRSLTKTFAIPGLRLGYILADAEIIQSLNLFRMPWSTNSLALEAGKYIMQNYQKLLPPKDLILNDAKQLEEELRKIEDLKIYPSKTNYRLCQLEKGTAKELKSYLAEKEGILIRNADNFRSLDESFFRVATKDKKSNNILARKIEEYLLQCNM